MSFDLLFRVGPAIKSLFELGYEPTKELFYELSAEQYRQLEREGGRDMSKSWHTLIPKDPRLDVPEVLIVDEEGVQALLDAAEYLHRFCAREKPGHSFASFDEKLAFAATQLPVVFSESSKYREKPSAPKLQRVK